MLDLETRITARIDLPSSPVIVQQISAVLARPDSSSAELSRIVETDQAFTARLLKLVNSPFYGFARRITSVTEALTMLGMNSVHQLLITTSVLGALRTQSHAFSMDGFWRHSFGVGVMAKLLLAEMDRETQSRAFMAGILHDIGRLILVRMDPDKCAGLYAGGEGVADLEREREWFGADHQEVGHMLAMKWNFPPGLVSAIAYHHTPDKATEEPLMPAAVSIGDLMCHALGIGFSGNEYVTSFSPSAWQRLGLNFEDLPGILERALDEVDRTEAFLSDVS